MIVKAEELQPGDHLYAGKTVQGPYMEVDRVELRGHNVRILFKNSFIAEYTCSGQEECAIERELPPPEKVEYKLYVHGPGKDSWGEMMEEDSTLLSLELSKDAKATLMYAASEVEFDTVVYKDGEVKATAVNGVKLEKPITLT